ncbi:serine/threonine-protein kinase [Streptomyces sp. NPDC046215]|uniref:Protein kinase domain-containing protein n=1 Tax=Streptomyces stramineus TaxID=173861 RepID=A0ABN1AHS3_9ACTN
MENLESLRPEDPRTLGAYRLLGRLGAGGMGRVYLARSDRGRTVAVKLVHRELAGQEEFRRRFKAEVRAARQVGGEWTAPVLDADTEAEVPWVATGYIAGPSLRQVVDRDFGPLPERSVRILGAGLARALQAIHATGIVHRDLKPSNVLITLDGPRVIDFGIARALETVTDGDGLTRTGAAVGSPGFMSPEQVRGVRITPASDVFCLGSVLAYAATGRMPFGTADSGVHALMFRIAEEQPDLTDVPDSLRPLIEAFLAKEPGDRPTPDQVLEQTGVEELLGGLSSADPWLPGGLVARLGRHAVQLLDVEEPVGTAGPLPPEAARPPAPHHEPTRISPQDPPTVTAGAAAGPPAPPAPGAAYGYPHAGPYGSSPYHSATHIGGPYAPVPPRRSRTPVLLAGVVAAGLLAGGGTVFLIKHGADGDTSASSAPQAPGTPASPSAGSTPPSPAPGSGPATPVSGAVPREFLGSWHFTFDVSGHANYRRLVLRQGSVGATVATINASGTTDDGTAYRCAWAASLTGGGTSGTPLRLSPSRVTLGEPATACPPGEATELTLLANGRLSRYFVGTDKAPQVYDKTG